MYTNKTFYPYDILILHKVENIICEIYIIQYRYMHFSFKWIISNSVVVFFYQLYLINILWSYTMNYNSVHKELIKFMYII